MFFGYDLPDDITEDDILSFLEEYEQSIVSIEVELNEKHGNYARVTFETSIDAREAMTYYSGQYWYELGIYVVLKPWKEKERTQKKKRQHSKHIYDDDDDDNDFNACSESVDQQSEIYSYNSSYFLLPYPGSHDSKAGTPICSEDGVKSTESRQQEKKLTGSSGSRKEEYTIKISGLNFDVKEKDVLKLVKPFGDLTSPVRIASYPQNGICYAYVNYCSSSSARAAVSGLDKSEFIDVRIHVCHRGKLGVDHSCRKKLQELAEEEYDDTTTDSVDSVKQVQDTSILHVLQVGGREPENMAAATSSTSVSNMHLKPLTDSSRPDISNADNWGSGVSHKSSSSKVDAFSKVFTNVEDTYSPHTEKQAAKKSRNITSYASVAKSPPKSVEKVFTNVEDTYSPHTEKQTAKKSRNATSYVSVAKSPPKSVEKVSSGKKPSQGKKSKLTINTPEESKVDHSSKYQSSSDPKPCTLQTRPLFSSIDDLPDIGPTKKQVADGSVDQTLPQCVKVLFDNNTLAQQPVFYTDTIDTSLSRSDIKGYSQSEHQASNNVQIFSEDSSSNPNLPPTISPRKQLTETFGDATSHSFVTQSSPQAIKIVQGAKLLRQQPKFDPDAVRSNCILEVTNLHPDASVQDLERYFKPYGTLKAPISIRLHPVSDSCSAIVHYVSADAAQNAMNGLNGCDISGYQMHIVNANDKTADMKLSTDVTPIISDSTTVSLVSSSNFHTPVKKTENNTALSAQ